jgi:hypothetical protein
LAAFARVIWREISLKRAVAKLACGVAPENGNVGFLANGEYPRTEILGSELTVIA